MTTIELDIIKQRCDKLGTEEKLDLIDYLTSDLTDEEFSKLAMSNRREDDPDKRSGS